MNDAIERSLTEVAHRGIMGTTVSGVDFLVDRCLRLVPQLYRNFAPRYYQFRAANDVYEYDCPPNLFKIERVDPNQITRFTQRDHPAWKDRRVLFGAVKAGDWDQPGNSSDRHDDITKSSNYRVLQQRFDEGMEWQETDKYQRCLEKIKRGESTWKGATSEDDLRAVCERMDALYESIESNGYRSVQKRLENGTAEYPDGLFLNTLDEITVDVARDGELLLVDGKHRLAIAQILNLESVPVVFLVRHEQWMNYREEVCERESIPEHPDLRDLIGSYRS